MFRRLSNSLPEDPDYPEDLEALGYVKISLSTLPMMRLPGAFLSFQARRT